MILESLVTTMNSDGSVNVSPMGPRVDETGDLATFELRPFDSSRTFANLKRNRVGVLHVSDDVELFARTAIGKLASIPPTKAADKVACEFLADACRAYEFKVEFIDETGPRMNLNCRTVQCHRLRDFWGFNRAKHAVLEVAILATRIDFLPPEEIQTGFARSEQAILKTGGNQESKAFGLLVKFAIEQGISIELQRSWGDDD